MIEPLTYRVRLSDGRTLFVNLLGPEGPDQDAFRGCWEGWLEDDRTKVIVGSPLAGTLADLLGYEADHDEWPGWIDELAASIEREFGIEATGS